MSGFHGEKTSITINPHSRLGRGPRVAASESENSQKNATETVRLFKHGDRVEWKKQTGWLGTVVRDQEPNEKTVRIQLDGEQFARWLEKDDLILVSDPE